MSNEGLLKTINQELQQPPSTTFNLKILDSAN